MEEEEVPSSVSVSFNSFVSLDNPRTMQLVKKIDGKEVAVLIHNFISFNILEKLGFK